MPVEYLDPTAEEAVEIEPYELFADTTGPLDLALIANSFPDGTRFMDKLEEVLVELLPAATIHRYQKPNVAHITDEQLETISRECDAVISAWGH